MSLQLIQTDCADFLQRLTDIAKRAQSAGDNGLLGKIRDAKTQTELLQKESRQPVRIGLVGAFNAGKTRLLEALLGCAGRLNVIDKPATGNIVEFELQVGDVKETQLSEWKLNIMSETHDAGRILRRLLAEAHDLQNRERSQNPAIAELDRLLSEAQEFGESSTPRWMKAQEWASKAHALAHANQYKAVAFEVYRLAYTVGQAPEWLGREFRINEADAISLMSLDYDPQEVFSQNLSQWRNSVPNPPTSNTIEGITPKELKSLFPIVRKIVVRATLPKLIAQPFGGGGLEVRFVDCPGAGADGSNFRDTVLCAQELKDVDTVFALLNAKNPGENRQFIDELLRIWGVQAKDRILAIVSRFDELPHNKNVSAGKRDALAQVDAPLTDKELFEFIPTLDTMNKAAMHTVMDGNPERICYVSTMGYLSERLQEEHRGLRGLAHFYQQELGFPPASSKTGSEASDQGHQSWVQEMGQWHGIAERLSLDSRKESKALGETLRDFASDGGFERLHRMLQKHLAQHGQANKLARLMPQRSQLQQLIAELTTEAGKLKDIAEAPAASAAPAMSQAEAIHTLHHVYDAFANSAESEIERATLKRRSPGSMQSEPILPPLRRGLIGDIMRWEEWRLLFSRIGKSAPGLVEFVDPTDPSLQKREADLRDERQTPVKSEDFKKPFLASLQKMQKALRERCLEGVRLHGENMMRDLESRLGGPVALENLRTVIGADAKAQPFQSISEAMGSNWLMDYLPEATPENETRSRNVHEAYFPLQHGQDPLYYAWHLPLHQKHGQNFDDRHRHLMYIVKLRQAIIDAALNWLDDVTHEVESSMRATIVGHLKKVRNDLREDTKRFPQELESLDYAD